VANGAEAHTLRSAAEVGEVDEDAARDLLLSLSSALEWGVFRRKGGLVGSGSGSPEQPSEREVASRATAMVVDRDMETSKSKGQRQLGDLRSLRGVQVNGVAEERGSVALRPRLSPSVPLSRVCGTELRSGTETVKIGPDYVIAAYGRDPRGPGLGVGRIFDFVPDSLR
jgi:hypothetical protein